MKTFGQVLGTIALFLVGAVGLLMSLCGGVFSVTALGSPESIGALVISLPSLLIGVVLMWVARRKLRRGRDRLPRV